MPVASQFVALPIVALLAGCAATQPEVTADYSPIYIGIERNLLDVDLVNMRVRMTGARSRQDVAAYAECAVAQYALKRGYGFARQVRTNVTNEAGHWLADAVYTNSATLPQGLRTIDADVTVQNCAALGIPTT